ncbi:hypothetical protein CSAL01_07310 [Colletotrichum salicis]|uniref:Fungal N-terminal domain-containing protein n=1 Tax=Colletotrichum salicis TaxID=1209931 RepID=A0A135UHB8_9PEZI|nr:hypothetical protein CSAL01_07310 [Colletotrichum salicis]
MEKALGKDYDVCQGVMEEIACTAQSFQDGFRCFDELTAECRQANGECEGLKDSVRHLRGRVKITLDESKFEKHIQDLRASIDDLKRIREQRSELKQHMNELIANETGSREFESRIWAYQSSQKDIESLSRSPRRSLVDPEYFRGVKGDVQMHVAISCMGHEHADRTLAQERLARILVRSQIRTWIDAENKDPTSAAPDLDGSPRQKRRKVRFLQDLIARSLPAFDLPRVRGQSQPIDDHISSSDVNERRVDDSSRVHTFHHRPTQSGSRYDLSFYQMSGDFSRCLRTLHLGFDFVQSSAISLPRSMEGIEATAMPDSSDGGPGEVETAAERAKLEYGIRDLTPWSLGIILHQIGRWSSLEAPEDVLSVWRLSQQVPTLGPKYRDLTRKCLECDFGFGDDLLKFLGCSRLCTRAWFAS